MKDLNSDPQSLDDWTRLLCEQEMPIFSFTAQKIYRTLDDSSKGAMDLASVILQDPNLTTKLLKISNSSYYNPSRQKMNTVSRAIVVLGSEVIRELTLACSFFESILSPENKERGSEEIGNAIHAAVQAKALAIAAKDPSPEEVFIAALLHHIGKIAFWCIGGQQGEQIDTLIKNGSSQNDAEKKVLGFNLTALDHSLNKFWQLGGLIGDSLNHRSSSNKRIQYVEMGHKINNSVKQGWDSEEMESCLDELVEITKQSKQSIKINLRHNTDTAVKIARQFGAHDASKLIQRSTSQPEILIEDDETANSTNDKKQLQFQILQDITTIMSSNFDINLIFEMVLEGIHRGIGMDRTLFAMLSTDKKRLIEKMSLGWSTDNAVEKTKFNLTATPPNLFFRALHQVEGIWSKPSSEGSLYSPHVVKIIGRIDCFLIPVYANERPVGLFYTDRSISQQELTRDDFDSAKHFTRQASIGLEIYRIKKPRVQNPKNIS